MSLSLSLSNAMSGLTASARMAEIVSTNVANNMTEGYGRKEVELAVSGSGGSSGGVRIAGITRTEDRAAITARRLTDADLGRNSTLTSALQRLEKILGAPDDNASLPARINALEAALVAAGAEPASDIRLSGVLGALTNVGTALGDAEAGIRQLREEADRSISDQTNRLNESLLRIDQINKDVTRARVTGSDVSGLLDQRQQVIDSIGEILPIREMERPGGQVALMTSSGMMLLDGKVARFGFDARPVITADMTFASGALSGLTMNGQPLNLTDGIGKATGGSLGAAFTLRDEILVQAQTGLDELARDLVLRFEDSVADPTLAPGQPGLFTDAGAPLNAADLAGLSGRIIVNALVDPARGGTTRLLRDGLGASVPGPNGDATQLDRWLAALSDNRSLLSGGAPGSASGLASGLASRAGTDRVSAETEMIYSRARRDTLYITERSDGVNIDQEMQRLLVIEQSYAANARVIQTVQSMIQALLEI